MALLIGAMIVLGIAPGPSMLTDHLDLSLTLVWVIAVSGVIAALIVAPLARYLAKITFIPGAVLVPIILTLALTGAYGYREIYNDVLVAVIFGIIGLTLRRYDYNRPALLLGFILGPLFEKFLFIAIKVDGPLFFVRPISLGLIIAIIAVLGSGPIVQAIKRRRASRA